MSADYILREKLETLLQGVNENYGKILTNELLSSLENTITDFNDEVLSLLNDLKENATLKDKMMEDIKAGKTEEQTSDKRSYVEETKEMSEWEKRLETLSN
ncbi:MAG: hypothetical protein IIB95_08970 [Candidatus Marinimicrobia bacterium]|nr:hypothetical protein [Candidatus Neomarinimicrobiota bacterium]MCH7763861.1 hypothetical protein [Candidatus Neomarinimicrobiota bacterium]